MEEKPEKHVKLLFQQHFSCLPLIRSARKSGEANIQNSVTTKTMLNVCWSISFAFEPSWEWRESGICKTRISCDFLMFSDDFAERDQNLIVTFPVEMWLASFVLFQVSHSSVVERRLKSGNENSKQKIHIYVCENLWPENICDYKRRRLPLPLCVRTLDNLTTSFCWTPMWCQLALSRHTKFAFKRPILSQWRNYSKWQTINI